MKIMLKIWVVYGILGAVAILQTKCEPDYLTQDSYQDADDKSYQPSGVRYQQATSTSHDELPNDPRHYQSLESRYQTPEVKSYYRQYHPVSQPVQYQQPEDPSYHRPQELAYQRSPVEYQPSVYQYQQPYQVSSAYPQSEEEHQAPPQHRQHYQGTSHYSQPETKGEYQAPPEHKQHYQGASHYSQPDTKKEYQAPPEHKQHYQKPDSYHSAEAEEDDSKYGSEEEDSKYVVEEPKYGQGPAKTSSAHPAPVPTDPKLPLYFTMYEKRIVQDPLDKYGKGPWRYLQYGHGITYGSKEPGKVFEKGYGYIRALGRDHCKLPEHLCPPREEKPFDYEGRKEPYFGYRPH